ncbi:uracil-DNA glycosylase-like protein [Phlebopus sp. FC_14]|nr:uracil-DNA glycosylase-like protein [Phlebopus sp. FC_14]
MALKLECKTTVATRDTSASATASSSTTKHKRKRTTSEQRIREPSSSDSDSDAHISTGNSRGPRSSSKKAKRGYAEPEVYAHLHLLQDYLQSGLDVVFCGINPGYMSAQVGHHFANPTNHFWRCLHKSELTSTFVPPSEDYTLMERFNIGLTNLVDRPSAEASELSKSEMVASVPAFLEKIALHKPRFVCFVGMGIWDIVKTVLAKMHLSSTAPSTNAKNKGKQEKRQPSQLGLQSYKLVYPSSEDTDGDVKASETLFFVVPSTSGRVVQYQLTDKIGFFTELRTFVHKSPAEIDTSAMQSIVLET